MERNCMNCARVIPAYDGRSGECPPNGMRVNARMCCEEWLRRLVGATSVRDMTTEKRR